MKIYVEGNVKVKIYGTKELNNFSTDQFFLLRLKLRYFLFRSRDLLIQRLRIGFEHAKLALQIRFRLLRQRESVL